MDGSSDALIADAPEIDGMVFIESSNVPEKVSPGEIVPVTVTGAEHYDLFGKVGPTPRGWSGLVASEWQQFFDSHAPPLRAKPVRSAHKD